METQEQSNALVLNARLTIQESGELKSQLLGALQQDESVTLDGSAVAYVDTAALQALLAFAQDARGRQLNWSWSATSEALISAAQILALADELSLR